VYKNKKLVDAVPFDRDEYNKMDKKYFDSFNEALDYFFPKIDRIEKKRRKKKLRKKKRLR